MDVTTTKNKSTATILYILYLFEIYTVNPRFSPHIKLNPRAVVHCLSQESRGLFGVGIEVTPTTSLLVYAITKRQFFLLQWKRFSVSRFFTHSSVKLNSHKRGSCAR